MKDIDIARAAIAKPIQDIADRLSIPASALKPYGHDKAKIDLNWLQNQPAREDSKLVLVTAINPTPAGEGKTTTTVGLGGWAECYW
jgi:formate--tetrahydrofolate ligase